MNQTSALSSMSIEELVNAFELTDTMNDENIPTVRGWLMDEMEARNPEAFDAWLDCADGSGPREFFLN